MCNLKGRRGLSAPRWLQTVALTVTWRDHGRAHWDLMSANATKVGPDTQATANWLLEDIFELATILDSILDTARSLIPADAYAIWLLESDRDEWRIAASRGLSSSFSAHMPGGADA